LRPEPRLTAYKPGSPLPFPDPPLEDRSVVLRPWQQSDVAVLVAAGQDRAISRFRYSLPSSSEGARQWLEEADRDRSTGNRLDLAITADRCHAVGSISLTDFESGNAMIRYWLLPEARGGGLATRAVKLVVGWAFSALGIGRLAMLIEPENHASRAVAERSAFAREGLLRQLMEGDEGERIDLLIYGLLPADLPDAAPGSSRRD
jgi:RimJ/RimL family protein N-acetyltransferase